VGTIDQYACVLRRFRLFNGITLLADDSLGLCQSAKRTFKLFFHDREAYTMPSALAKSWHFGMMKVRSGIGRYRTSIVTYLLVLVSRERNSRLRSGTRLLCSPHLRLTILFARQSSTVSIQNKQCASLPSSPLLSASVSAAASEDSAATNSLRRRRVFERAAGDSRGKY
jgi:hypothetical protein